MIALGAIVFAVVAPVSANGVLFLASPAVASRTCTDDTASTNFLARTTSGLSNTQQDAYYNLIKGLESAA